MLHSPPKRGRVGLHIKETFRAFIFYPLNLANLTDREDKRQRPFALDMANHTLSGLLLISAWAGCVAYPLSKAMREPKGWDRQAGWIPRFFYYVGLLSFSIIINAFPGSIRQYSSTAMENINRQVGYAAIMAIAFGLAAALITTHTSNKPANFIMNCANGGSAEIKLRNLPKGEYILTITNEDTTIASDTITID